MDRVNDFLDKHELSGEHEEDARYIYPKREDFLLKEIDRLESQLAAAREGLEEIESMATIETVEIQKVAQQTLERMGNGSV